MNEPVESMHRSPDPIDARAPSSAPAPPARQGVEPPVRAGTPEPTAKLPFFGLTSGEFDAAVVEWGWPRFRAQQVRDWVYGKGVTDPALMTNLGKRERDTLAGRVAFMASSVTALQASNDGTRKLLLSWENAPASERGPSEGGTLRVTEPAVAECVMIPDGDRRTACISSQVGCPVGCKFCASGINGVKGNLTAARIVEQVYRLNEMLSEEQGRHEGTKARGHGGQPSHQAAPERPSSSSPSCLRASVPSCLASESTFHS